MSRLPLQRLLREARPSDPTGADFERAAVRVLARLAVLQGVPPAAPRTLRRRVAAAFVLVGSLALALSGSDGSTEPVLISAQPRPVSCVDLVAAALRGEAGARRSLSRRTAGGRACLWAAIEGGQGEALRLLRDGARPLGSDDLERVAALAVRPELTQPALDALAEEPARGACRQLGALLVQHAELERALVATLERVARRGGRAEALEALLQGAVAGRARAAAAVVALGTAATSERLLCLVPERVLIAPEVAQALRAARPTVTARVMQRARGGDAQALAWAAAARLEASIPLLHARAVGQDVADAHAALAALAHIDSVDAWLAIARATAAPGGAQAEHLLLRIGTAQAEALRERALGSVRDRPAALWALAAAGQVGFAALVRMAERPAFEPAVVEALATSPCRGAAEHLLALARRQDSSLPVVAALGRRLARGHADAGGALLALGRQGLERPVVEALAAAGEPGARFLVLAALDPKLGEIARQRVQRASESEIRLPSSAAPRRGYRPY